MARMNWYKNVLPACIFHKSYSSVVHDTNIRGINVSARRDLFLSNNPYKQSKLLSFLCEFQL